MQNSLIAILKCQIQKKINLEEEIKIYPEYIQNKHMCNTKNNEDMSGQCLKDCLIVQFLKIV